MQPCPFIGTNSSGTMTVAASGTTTLGTITVNGMGGYADVSVFNIGANALTDFSLAVQSFAGSPYATRLDGTDWGTATTVLVESSGGVHGSQINTLAANGTAWFTLFCTGFNSIQLSAAATGGATTLVVGGGSNIVT